MEKMYESSTSQVVKLGKRPASSSATLEKRSKKRATEGEEETHGIIQLKVKSQEKEVIFNVKRSTKMEKILRMFCEKARVEYRTMNFFIDGHSFPVNKTADELHLSNGDEIEAHGWQTGA
ncbi:Ubiquitin-like domain-containing protein [Heracleum sosnowskyi]|uniref:Ubiquitin-like domain-containing protein n=1 Tax=Heracleum sosnowskyi TaxID=360622 RepID=A0AAD8IB29_9APIA|nr:Ubiquitin-like domain-containing protein [Heracleum sosnowskyi]